MSNRGYSRKAEADLVEIAIYSAKNWGPDQATRYVRELDRFCQNLAEHPRTGRLYSIKHKSWMRIEHASHVVFYRCVPGGIFVQRVLHKSRLPGKHLPL